MPGQAEATVQFIQHGLWVLPQLGEHDQAVEPQVGGFVDHIAAVAADLGILGSDDRLDGFFACSRPRDASIWKCSRSLFFCRKPC